MRIMRISLGTLLISIVVFINFLDGSKQPPHKGQPTKDRRKRRDSESLDPAATQGQFDGQSSRPRLVNNLGGLPMPKQPMHIPISPVDNYNAATWLSLGREQTQGGYEMPLSRQTPTGHIEHDFFASSSHQAASPRISHMNTPTPEQYDASTWLSLKRDETRVDAADNPESSSVSLKKRGGYRPGAGRPPGLGRRAAFHLGEVFNDPLQRAHDKEVIYMKKLVLLWIHQESQTRVEQAFFEGMTRPRYPAFYRNYHFLVRLDNLDGLYPTVVYLWKNGTIMGVRAPKKMNADIMEPTDEMWFIVYLGKYFRLFVEYISAEPVPFRIETADRQGRSWNKNDVSRRVKFPYAEFCVYGDRVGVQGAFIPGKVADNSMTC